MKLLNKIITHLLLPLSYCLAITLRALTLLAEHDRAFSLKNPIQTRNGITSNQHKV